MDRSPGDGSNSERKTVLLQRNALKFLRGPDGKEEVCNVIIVNAAMPAHLSNSHEDMYVQEFPPVVEESMEKLSPGLHPCLLYAVSLQDVVLRSRLAELLCTRRHSALISTSIPANTKDTSTFTR